jgi:hypothetical protein
LRSGSENDALGPAPRAELLHVLMVPDVGVTVRQNGSYVLRSGVFGSRIVTPTTKSHALEIMNVSAATIATAATYSPAMRSATSNAAPGRGPS